LTVPLTMGATARQGKPAAKPQSKPISAAKAGERKPFVEKIPGSLVTFEMLPVPAPPGGKPFYLAKTETTWDAYDIFAYRLDLTEAQKAADVDAASRPSKPYGAPDRGFGHQGYAAVGVAFHAAGEYCNWLSKKTGKKYRLPTEAEWEWACRAGGSDAPLSPDDLKKAAWYFDTTEDKTQAVGTKAANAWGLHDMLGNVWEWCTTGPNEPGVVRGGSYQEKAKDLSPKTRSEYNPDWQLSDAQNPKSRWWLSDGPQVGFRVVCEM
jgi:formylglycine-generating enzyme required for sulfatase activity